MHDTAVAECSARWLDGAADRRYAWKRIARGPEPAGYDPATIWPDGPGSSEFAVLELTPWRIRTSRPPAAPRVIRFHD